MADTNPTRFTTADGLYTLTSEASRGDIADQLLGRLSQLSALLTAAHGEGAPSFARLSEGARDNYLWACASMARECSDLAELAVEWRRCSPPITQAAGAR